MKRSTSVLLLNSLLAAGAFAPLAWAETPSAVPTPTNLHVGLRRSSYGGRHTPDNAWWIARAREFAAHFPGAKPTIVEIVSVYLDDGTTQFEFGKPDSYVGPAHGMTFRPDKTTHEQALNDYDMAGISVVLQVEPGNADLKHCLEAVNLKFGKHPCVIGLGVDAEWFFTKESPKHDGRPITDAEAKELVETVRALNPHYTLFLKHFSTKHLPPTFRHPNLHFISDSQDFESADEMLSDFKKWGKRFEGATTGYQFGYPKDRAWWGALANPPLELADRIRTTVPSCAYLIWVDFTANQVRFERNDSKAGASQ